MLINWFWVHRIWVPKFSIAVAFYNASEFYFSFGKKCNQPILSVIKMANVAAWNLVFAVLLVHQTPWNEKFSTKVLNITNKRIFENLFILLIQYPLKRLSKTCSFHTSNIIIWMLKNLYVILSNHLWKISLLHIHAKCNT